MRHLLVLFAAFAVSACGFKSPEARVDAGLDTVKATDAQRATIKKATTAFFDTAKKEREARLAARDTIKAELAGDKPSEEKLAAAATTATQSFVTTAHAFIDAGAVVHDTLSKEQRATLSDDIKPNKGARAAWFVAGRMGFGPPDDAKDAEARAQKGVDRMLNRIEATDAQRKVLEPLALSLAKDAAPLLDDQKALGDALLTAWKSDAAVDTKALHALIDADAGKIDALAKRAAADAVTAHGVLTKEQRAKLLDR
jgi:hypothetical protein